MKTLIATIVLSIASVVVGAYGPKDKAQLEETVRIIRLN
ncbi:hypothetical protein Solca_2691 [Solitalea canadensis DSM 3403]|uniref:Uncharacterized protein n=1 Tax=Solitalea canadensis (strain ATCC 29591 / DSM 3403 / JCM 21819 / LMG 8368 / NBRC 15130 / NCIMB 12057 / USAM 9D) TaxID=929556 RepID=H8KRT7_SOLCM|nr:hypothetical protein Solca_2691 [Solitalea canadensis DSM 3403]